MMTDAELINIVKRIRYKSNYVLNLLLDPKSDRWYLQVQCERPDSYTGELTTGYGGKIYLSQHMTKAEVVRKAFAAFMQYEEHECREFFKYAERRIFGPHIDVEALWDIAERTEVRS